jgi:hypothetical protein
MSSCIIPLNNTHLTSLVKFADGIYENAKLDKYPDFRISADIDENVKRTKFFSAFLVSSSFNDHNIRQAYAFADDNGVFQAAVGVRRYGHMPSWSVGWLLSPSLGSRFIPMFRKIMNDLCKIHEDAGMNEFYVTYPTSREAAYSKIMLPFRDRYYSFIECTLPAKTVSPYGLIHSLMGTVIHPHDMTLRRYILRRENTEAESQGGIINRKSNK